MCLFGIPKDEDIVFVDRRAPRLKSTQIVRQRRSSHSRPVSRVSETIIRQHSHRPSTSMTEIHRHSTSMSEMHRAQSHRHSTSMTEIHQAPAPPTLKPVTPVPVHAFMAPPTPPASNFGYPPPPPSAAGGYPPPPMSVAPPPPHQYIPPPSPSIMPASPLPSYRDLSPPRVPTPPEESRVELIKVEEEHWPPHSRSHSHGRSSPSASHVSRGKSRRGSVTGGRGRERSDREEIYIQRDRIIERGTPSPHPPPSPSSFARRGSRSSRGSGTPEPVQSGYRTVEGTGWDHADRRPITPSGYRVVEGAGARRGSGVGVVNVHREREWEREKSSASGSDFGGRRGSVTFENGARNSGRFAERERERERVVMDEGGRRREFNRRG
ncbi:hypothetical protein OCU04_000125 [Sclerotinia nivalis]|uniref:Uncharacterized protein n=1 Tax=Sclerotinia nivalis TaxID=352851 RepID=A0A9X0AVY6_9HELO|nr:hypothetical protein OCU04_000125 [Sclerotinia nivalis]